MCVCVRERGCVCERESVCMCALTTFSFRRFLAVLLPLKISSFISSNLRNSCNRRSWMKLNIFVLFEITLLSWQLYASTDEVVFITASLTHMFLGPSCVYVCVIERVREWGSESVFVCVCMYNCAMFAQTHLHDPLPAIVWHEFVHGAALQWFCLGQQLIERCHNVMLGKQRQTQQPVIDWFNLFVRSNQSLQSVDLRCPSFTRLCEMKMASYHFRLRI